MRVKRNQVIEKSLSQNIFLGLSLAIMVTGIHLINQEELLLMLFSQDRDECQETFTLTTTSFGPWEASLAST